MDIRLALQGLFFFVLKTTYITEEVLELTLYLVVVCNYNLGNATVRQSQVCKRRVENTMCFSFLLMNLDISL